jgi:FtsP/CotA-like multicopper oxidase with cupredoxin domain
LQHGPVLLGALALPATARDDSPRMHGVEKAMPSVTLDGPLHLTAVIERRAVLPGRTTAVWGYRAGTGRASTFNPALRALSGQIIDVTLGNRLGEDTTIHWHGLHVDERNDGSGMYPVRNGSSYVYRFNLRNRGGLYWYHAHPHHRTAIQLHGGLAGMLLVEDDADKRLREALDLHLGDTELVLMLQDKAFDSLNRLRYEMGEDDWIGNRVLVNWTPHARIDLARRRYRLRLLNASNARTFRLALQRGSEPLPFVLIGTDGGLLDAPHTVQEIYLGPAQRVDLLIDLSALDAGDTVWLRSLSYEPMENEPVVEGQRAEMHRHGPVPMGEPMELLQLSVGSARADPLPLPVKLSAVSRIDSANATTRRFRLHTDGRRWYINGYNYHQDMHAILAEPTRGSVEVWDVANDEQSMPHPMHLHGFQFQVLARSGSPEQIARLAISPDGLSAQDLGWLDTVLVWPGETVRIAIDFSHPFPGDQLYMFHCHNLEHEDQGMMLNFRVRG